MESDDEEETKEMIGERTETILEFNNYMDEHKFLQPKNNFIPKCMVPLKHSFDRNGLPFNPVFLPKDEDIEDFNIGKEK
jgi:hypothetical protein